MTDEEELPQVVHELNVTRGKLKQLIKQWDELSEEQQDEELQRCQTLLGYAVER